MTMAFDLQVNFAPAGSFVDIHIGVFKPTVKGFQLLTQNRPGPTWFVPLYRIPQVYMASVSTNIRESQGVAHYSGESGDLTEISGQLTGGYIAHVDSSRAVYFPPRWLHAQHSLGIWLESTLNSYYGILLLWSFRVQVWCFFSRRALIWQKRQGLLRT